MKEPERSFHYLHQMLRIRRFEEKCAELYSAQKIRGFLHLYIGEEAVAVGTMEHATQGDSIVATYREHGQALVRGVPMRGVMAEMYGKIEGVCRGRGGSMHIFDAGTRFYGGNAIVAGGLPLAVGIALAEKMQGTKNTVFCFFGDGAVAEGEFHESMNLAALWRLPVLFVCENNLYAMGTALARHESQTDLCLKAQSYRMHAVPIDGMDVFAVSQAVDEARRRVQATGDPCFLEMRTYRFRAHSMFDPDLYREKSEIEEWMKRDPILLLREHMKTEAGREGVALEGASLNEADIQAAEATIEAEIRSEIDDAVQFAESGSWEDPSDLLKDVCTPAEVR